MLRHLVGALTLGLIAQVASAQSDDCTLGDRYYQLAQKSQAEYLTQEALDYLQRSADACPTYRAWQELGELATTLGDPDANARAAHAFIEAYQVATTPVDQARAIGRYAELLFHTGDPQRAQKYAYEARDLDPANPWIADLAKQVSAQVAKVDAADIKRGLQDSLFEPLVIRRAVDAESGGARAGGGVPPSAVASAPRAANARVVNVPINFEYNSTRIVPDMAGNVAVLAEQLAEAAKTANRILIIGHADARGDATANVILSRQRADAVRDEIVRLEPSLSGRIYTDGRGAREPIARGTTEEDYRINRRVEAVVE
jgi:outer membrane protein OmpA-like peptidoglycan-associated protein